MEQQLQLMADKLSLTATVQNALDSGGDIDLITDVIFGLYCGMLKQCKQDMTQAIDTLNDLDSIGKLLATTAIRHDRNYLYD
jgi:hypothetical protein